MVGEVESRVCWYFFLYFGSFFFKRDENRLMLLFFVCSHRLVGASFDA